MNPVAPAPRKLVAMKLSVLLAVACIAAPSARAHDTWFERRPAGAGEVLLALGTGTQFPRFDSGIDAKYLVEQGCRNAGRSQPLQPLRNDDTALVVRGSGAAQACWAQLTPFEVDLAPDKIEVYLREIGADAALRATWAEMHARGLPWKESYTKNARIALADGASAEPVPLAMDVLLQPGGAPRAGRPLAFQVLRDGQPLPAQAVELRNDRIAIGIWRRTDGEGRFAMPNGLPAGRWVARAVDLRPSTDPAVTWVSRFVTLAFQVTAAESPPARTP